VGFHLVFLAAQSALPKPLTSFLNTSSTSDLSMRGLDGGLWRRRRRTTLQEDAQA